MIDGLFSYSGSDQTNEVSSLLRKFLAEGDGWSYEKRMGLLEDLLSIERDPNWNGYLHYLSGAEKLLTQDYPGAVGCFLEADRQFDPLGANFADISSPYCRNRFEIIREKWRDEGDDEKIIEYALSVLAWKSDDTFSQYEEMVLLNCLGLSAMLQPHPQQLRQRRRWNSTPPTTLDLCLLSAYPHHRGFLENDVSYRSAA